MATSQSYGATDSSPGPAANTANTTSTNPTANATSTNPTANHNNGSLNGNGVSPRHNSGSVNGNGVLPRHNSGSVNGNGVLPTVADGIPPETLAKGKAVKLWAQKEIDTQRATVISVVNCFLTGFTSAVAFTACYVWPGFQTGNVAQLAISLSRLYDPPPHRTSGFQKSDQQALTSLICFWIGSSLGRIGARLGPTTRRWILLATLIQVILTVVAACLVIGEEAYGTRLKPSWADVKGMAALGCLSAGLGVQGIVGKRVGSAMNTTVVLTTTWVEIFNDPGLFKLGRVKARDARIAGVLAVFVGAFIGRALIGATGGAGALGVLAGLRALSALGWAGVPAKS